MVEKRNCSFCGEAIEPGTGKMYIKKDGTVFNFCSNKCKKNNINLERVSRRTRWTTRYAELKAGALSREQGEEPAADEKAPEKPAKKPAAKPKKVAEPKAAKPAEKPAAVKPKAAPAKKKEAPAKE
jgi:large subunit ribosomal protein L24e